MSLYLDFGLSGRKSPQPEQGAGRQEVKLLGIRQYPLISILGQSRRGAGCLVDGLNAGTPQSGGGQLFHHVQYVAGPSRRSPARTTQFQKGHPGQVLVEPFRGNARQTQAKGRVGGRPTTNLIQEVLDGKLIDLLLCLGGMDDSVENFSSNLAARGNGVCWTWHAFPTVRYAVRVFDNEPVLSRTMSERPQIGPITKAVVILKEILTLYENIVG
eukprot:scaffold5771_cov171-Amphora_coffeaeformis.AAC.28